MSLGQYSEMRTETACCQIWQQVKTFILLSISEAHPISSIVNKHILGLGSILFAISIDKLEFNVSITPRPVLMNYREEPVIQVPVPGKLHSILSFQSFIKWKLQIIKVEKTIKIKEKWLDK